MSDTTHTVDLVGAEGLTPPENQWDQPYDPEGDNDDLTAQDQAASSLASIHGNETVTIPAENSGSPERVDADGNALPDAEVIENADATAPVTPEPVAPAPVTPPAV